MSGVSSQLPVFVPRRVLPEEKTRGLRPQLSVEIAGAFFRPVQFCTMQTLFFVVALVAVAIIIAIGKLMQWVWRRHPGH